MFDDPVFLCMVDLALCIEKATDRKLDLETTLKAGQVSAFGFCGSVLNRLLEFSAFSSLAGQRIHRFARPISWNGEKNSIWDSQRTQ